MYKGQMRAGFIERPIVATSAGDFTPVYRRWFGSVVVWLRAVGVPEGELEDLAQEVFLVVRRKLDRFDGRNIAGWLYKIVAQTASDHRRRAWFRRLVQRAPESELDGVPSPIADPLRMCEVADAQRQLRRLLAQLKEPQRVAFWLFEIEEQSAHEIAEALGVSETAVAMRVHYARKELYRLVEAQRRKERP
jgi:RNA polymerase sigma-70 factor (ECF subfamily)